MKPVDFNNKSQIKRQNEKHAFYTNYKKRGMAIIFNQENFDSSYLNPRLGSINDAKNLLDLFKKFNFETKLYFDYTAYKIEALLRKVAADDHFQNYCLIIVVLTYGMPGKIHAKDIPYDINKLWEPFAGNACKTLIGKPKIFLIQACDVTPKVEIEAITLQKIPSYADFLVVYSALPIHLVRVEYEPSCFIKHFCKELLQYVGDYHFLLLLSFVVRNVEFELRDKNIPYNELHLPYITSTLTRLIDFDYNKNS